MACRWLPRTSCEGETGEADAESSVGEKTAGKPRNFNFKPSLKANEILGSTLETRTDARTFTLTVPAPRGMILDRNGMPLAQTKIVYYAAINFPALKNASDSDILNYARQRISEANRFATGEWSLDDKVEQVRAPIHRTRAEAGDARTRGDLATYRARQAELNRLHEEQLFLEKELERKELLAPVTGDDVFAIESAEVSYAERGKGQLHAVRQLSVGLKTGETVAIVGESGSGKSSLVRAALGLVPLRAGRHPDAGAPVR